MKCPAIIIAKQKLIDAHLADCASFEGCPSTEIDSIESMYSLSLPSCYKDFLNEMGHAAGEFLLGTDYCFPLMLEFRTAAENLLKTCGVNFRLSPTTFVFLFHQGYNFLFFDCANEVDDPPVLLFTEGESEPRKVSDTFSSWLLNAVEDDIEADKELKANDQNEK